MKPYLERLEERNRLQADLKARLETKHGLAGHPKAQVLFHLSWEHGHSAGENEVEIYYDEFSELLK